MLLFGFYACLNSLKGSFKLTPVWIIYKEKGIMSKRRLRRSVLFAFIIVWAVGIGFGLKYLWTYQVSAGTAAAPPSLWPEDSRIPREKGQSTLVLLAHPKCPCTRATIGELAVLMAHCQGKVSVYILFFKPSGFPDNWEQTDLWHSAAVIPGVTVLADNDGVEAQRFGSVTSGQALLYGPDGNLEFSGGITASRGHSGDNAGRDAITALLLNGKSDAKTSQVFGCSLTDKNQNTNEKEACHATGK